MGVRFAPSPTGPFHLGNLRTAWISHAYARALGLPWVVRFEDIDRPRVKLGAQDAQLRALERLGMIPDRIIVQSLRLARHEDLFRAAVQRGDVYACTCSRREVILQLHAIASAPHSPAAVYHGACRDAGLATQLKSAPRSGTVAWRFKDPADSSGHHDFMIARTRLDGSDYVPAYHWACAIDDAEEGGVQSPMPYDLIVRAADLSTVLGDQRRIQVWLANVERREVKFPAVFHTALVVAADGARLEKRMSGITLDDAGITPAELLSAFERSFDRSLIPSAPSPARAASAAVDLGGRVWGETPSELRLTALV